MICFPFDDCGFRFSGNCVWREMYGDSLVSLSQICLTQSVVKGAPLAIRFLTSSSWPLRAASSRRFPRSTSDIWHTNIHVSITYVIQLPSVTFKSNIPPSKMPRVRWHQDCINKMFHFESFLNCLTSLTPRSISLSGRFQLCRVPWPHYHINTWN